MPRPIAASPHHIPTWSRLESASSLGISSGSPSILVPLSRGSTTRSVRNQPSPTISADEALANAVRWENGDPVVHDLLGLIDGRAHRLEGAASLIKKLPGDPGDLVDIERVIVQVEQDDLLVGIIVLQFMVFPVEEFGNAIADSPPGLLSVGNEVIQGILQHRSGCEYIFPADLVQQSRFIQLTHRVGLYPRKN